MSADGSWTDFDLASNQALILAAWRSDRISGAQAWELFTQHGLWGDKDEAFFHYVQGKDALETSRELWTAQPNFKKAVSKLIGFASKCQLVSPASSEWLSDLFGVGRKPCEE